MDAVNTSIGEAGESSIPDELSTEQKAFLDEKARKSLDFMQREYWRIRNGKQRFMRCPFCATERILNGKETMPFYRKNFIDGKKVCCALFARAFEAILDRQEEIDRAASAARTILAIGKMAEAQQN